MPTLENTSDKEGDIDSPSEAFILQWAMNPDEVMIENLRMLDTEPSEQQIATQELVLYDASRVESVLPMTTTEVHEARAAFRLSESSQVHNSGNSIQINFNYNASPLVTPSSSGTVTTSPPIPNQSDSISPLSSRDVDPVPNSQPGPSGADEQTPSESSGSEIDEYPEFPKAREDGCYAEPVTSAKAIHFPKNTYPYIKAYISSELFPGFDRPLIPLWTCRSRHRLIPVGDVEMIGDIGFFDSFGGFTSLFNIFRTRSENTRLGYDPPDSFEEYSTSKVGSKIVKRENLTPPRQNPIFHAIHGKFRREQDKKPSLLYVCANANVTDSSHGTVVAYHKALQARLDDRHPAAKRTAIQHYLNKHAAQWYKYYKEIDERHSFKNGQLMMVHTSLSTDSWASAAFTDGLSWEVGEYFARILPTDPVSPHLYSWETHGCVKAHSSHPLESSDPDVSDHCIAIGVDAIHIGDPPGHKRRKIKRSLFSLSQSFSAISMQSIASRLTIRRNQ